MPFGRCLRLAPPLRPPPSFIFPSHHSCVIAFLTVTRSSGIAAAGLAARAKGAPETAQGAKSRFRSCPSCSGTMPQDNAGRGAANRGCRSVAHNPCAWCCRMCRAFFQPSTLQFWRAHVISCGSEVACSAQEQGGLESEISAST